MSKGSPSMIALLGLLAVAGYQNRDKLGSMLQGAQSGRDDSPDDPRYRDANAMSGSGGSSDGGIVDNLRRMVTGAGGGGLAGGLSEILGRFTNPVQSAKAQSWVDKGPNGTIAAAELEEVLDEDTLADLTQKTGLSRSELLARLSDVLPDAVDQMTPDGKLPSPEEARGVY